jgi:hypothetical protein
VEELIRNIVSHAGAAAGGHTTSQKRTGKNYGRKLRDFYDVQEYKSSPIDIAGQIDWYWQRDELIILKLGRLRLFHEQTVYSSAACGELREFV